MKALERMNDAIERASELPEDADFRFIENVHDAIQAKHEFMRRAFPDGPCAQGLLFDLAAIDESLRIARASRRKRREHHLGSAEFSADLAAKKLSVCGSEGQQSLAAQNEEAIAELVRAHEAKELRDAELERATALIHARKQEILSGTTVHGCDVVRFYLSLVDADTALELAVRPATRSDRERRNRFLSDAERAGKRLVRAWRRVPCGSSPTPPAERCTGAAVNDGPNEYRVGIVCDSDATTFFVERPGGPFTADLPPPGASCQTTMPAGNGRYTCNGNFPGDQPVPFNLRTDTNASGETWRFDVANGRATGTIEVP